MARRPTQSQRRAFAALIAEMEPRLRAAFEEAARELHDGVLWGALIEALTAGNVEDAIAALRIDAGAYAAYAEAKTAAFAAAGALTAQTMPIGRLPRTRWNMTNPAAEAWIRANVADKVTEIVAEQIATVRETILTGYQAGRHPQSIAVDIAGRVQGGTRQGGVLGLDSERARRLDAVTRGMETPEGVRRLVIRHRDGTYGMRYQVNPATRNRIMRAYHAGEAVPAADRAVSVRQYSNALLKARAETVAQTETGFAVAGGRDEQWRAFMAARNIPDEAIIKTFVHGGGVKDPRPHHVAMNGTTVRGLDTPFVFSNDATLRFAHDPEGAASEVINCTCDTTYSLAPDWDMS